MEIQQRRIGKLQTSTEKFISTTLKTRNWMTDGDVRNALSLSSVDFAIIRADHANLQMEALDENRRKVLIWVHPDYHDQARRIINGEE